MIALRSILYRHRFWLTLLLLTWGVFFIFLFARIFEEQPDGFYAGHEHVWGDWAIHTAMVNIFAHKDPGDWFAYHPIYAGGKFTYPFLTNMISGLLIRWFGFSLPLAFILPSILFSLVLIFGIYFLGYLLTRSKDQAYLALTIFLMSSGGGFVNFIRDMWRDPRWENITYPFREYSRFNQYDWGTGNIIIGMLMPQRAYLFGMMLGVLALVGLIYVLKRPSLRPGTQKSILLIAGLCAGVMPIAHAHSFIALIILSGWVCLFYWRRWRLLAWFVVPAGILSSLLYFVFVAGGIENQSFIAWLPGWTAHGGVWGWLEMWIILWSIMLPTALRASVLFWYQMSAAMRAITIAAWMIFGMANLWLFQPVRWDNTKLFFWAYLFFCMLAAMLIAYFWQTRERFKRALAVLCVIFLTFTGALELTRLQQIKRHRFLFANTEDIQLGKEIAQSTDSRARFLTAPNHNSLIMLWAMRPILLGYQAWAWNYGFNYQSREQDMRLMYPGGARAEDLLRQYEVSYVLIGSTEIASFRADEPYFASRFPLAFQNRNYRVYDTRQLFQAR